LAGENMYTELEYSVLTTAVSPEMDIESQESNASSEGVSFVCCVHTPELSRVKTCAEPESLVEPIFKFTPVKELTESLINLRALLR